MLLLHSWFRFRPCAEHYNGRLCWNCDFIEIKTWTTSQSSPRCQPSDAKLTVFLHVLQEWLSISKPSNDSGPRELPAGSPPLLFSSLSRVSRLTHRDPVPAGLGVLGPLHCYCHCHTAGCYTGSLNLDHCSDVLIFQPPAFPCSLCVLEVLWECQVTSAQSPVGIGNLQSWRVPLVGGIRLIPCHWFIVLRGHYLNLRNNYSNTIYHFRPSFKNATNPNQL